MDNLEINLDDEFKNISMDTTNNDTNMGIDLLMGTSPKKTDTDVKSVKSDDVIRLILIICHRLILIIFLSQS